MSEERSRTDVTAKCPKEICGERDGISSERNETYNE
jgi:hypothetical protein